MWYPKACLVPILLLAAAVFIAPPVLSDDLHDCMVQTMDSASPETTIGELRQRCQEQIQAGTWPKTGTESDQDQLVTERIRQERKNVLKPFSIMAHKPNYLLVASYNRTGYNEALYREASNRSDLEFDQTEAKFQISIKFPLLIGLFNDTLDVYAAYTNRSFWQVYNTEESSPFRETDHEPEAWIQFHPDWQFLGFKNTWNSIGFNHQSNGRGGTLSRSWNRVFAWLTIERGNLAMSIKPWYRIPEDEENDDNPDITDYMGHYEISAAYKWKKNVFSVMSRNNLESGFSRGAVELSWSFPLPFWPHLMGYVQYFNGYGESLIDYNQYVNSIGIGFALTDWL